MRIFLFFMNMKTKLISLTAPAVHVILLWWAVVQRSQNTSRGTKRPQLMFSLSSIHWVCGVRWRNGKHQDRLGSWSTACMRRANNPSSSLKSTFKRDSLICLCWSSTTHQKTRDISSLPTFGAVLKLPRTSSQWEIPFYCCSSGCLGWANKPISCQCKAKSRDKMLCSWKDGSLQAQQQHLKVEIVGWWVFLIFFKLWDGNKNHPMVFPIFLEYLRQIFACNLTTQKGEF